MSDGERDASNGDGRRAGGVQSIARAFAVLELIAANGGAMGLSRLAADSGLPLPTLHRLARTLVDLGYLRQEPSRLYALGPRLLLLAESSATMLNGLAVPHLRHLVDELGETANLAMLDGDQVAYVAQAPGRHSMRMFTEVGRRVDAHATAVGKAVLATLPEETVTQMLQRAGMRAQTEHTITTIAAMHEELARTRRLGYALDDGEQEVGVRCYAVAVPGAPAGAAISISGPEGRMTRIATDEVIPLMQRLARALSAELTAPASTA
jgi:IclR family transcriptional regulator, acetate operon repressor